jgi:hypothetical protein
MTERTEEIKSEVERPLLRLEQLRVLIDAYARGAMSLGRYSRAAAALLRKPKEVPMIPIARAFAVAFVLFILACGGPLPEPPPEQPAQVAAPAAKPGCRWLATVDGPRCLPDGRDIFWESDSQQRVTDLGASVTVDSPDDVRWIFFLTAGEPSTIRQIVLVPGDSFRVSPTRFVIPHKLADVTIPLDWFGSFFE